MLQENAGPARNNRAWVSADFLLATISKQPEPSLLVTTGNLAVNGVNSGELGLASTKIVLGGSDLDYRSIPGLRVTAGVWLDGDRRFGFEGSAFMLGRQSTTDTVSSDGSKNSLALFVPFFNTAGQPRAFAFAIPNILGFIPASGAATLASSTQLWGAESTGVLNLTRGPRWSLDALGGFCYRQLDEGLSFDTTLTRTPAAPTVLNTTSDEFDTRNQFYGGQLGLRGAVDWRQLTFRAQTLVDLGSTHQVVSINGESTFKGFDGLAGFAPPTSSGEIFTQRSNIGTTDHNEFTVIPEMQLQVSCRLASWARLFIGYDALYWSNVVRPGKQIDPTVNTPGGVNEFLFGLHAPGGFAGGGLCLSGRRECPAGNPSEETPAPPPAAPSPSPRTGPDATRSARGGRPAASEWRRGRMGPAWVALAWSHLGRKENPASA